MTAASPIHPHFCHDVVQEIIRSKQCDVLLLRQSRI